jgi:hypothetical protein
MHVMECVTCNMVLILQVTFDFPKFHQLALIAYQIKAIGAAYSTTTQQTEHGHSKFIKITSTSGATNHQIEAIIRHAQLRAPTEEKVSAVCLVN